MSAHIIKIDALDSLPTIWPKDLLLSIQAQIKASKRKIVVLDDDPTGTQTVHGVPVLTTWTVEALTRELKDNIDVFYVLTNSRSLSAKAANDLGQKIGSNLAQAVEDTGVAVEVISRSDSTLRGHFPGEVNALKTGLGMPSLPCLLIPCFLEGGRYTMDDVHYVAEGRQLVPAAQTPYARDAVFGYRQSNLRYWVEEKTGGRITAEQITTITLADLRRGGPQSVADKLMAMESDAYGIVNIAAYRDLEVFVCGLLMVEAANNPFIFRSGASFVRVRAGISHRELLMAGELSTDNSHGGLFVVGSYVPKTTSQLAALIKEKSIAAVEISVENLLIKDKCEKEISHATKAVNQNIREGKDTVVFTSRKLITGSSDHDNLSIGKQVSDSLIQIVRSLDYQPRYLLAKGGITSSDVATEGLKVQRAMIIGQILPGVPVWRLGNETRYPGMSYIVFPGNVGDDKALCTIQKIMAIDTLGCSQTET